MIDIASIAHSICIGDQDEFALRCIIMSVRRVFCYGGSVQSWSIVNETSRAMRWRTIAVVAKIAIIAPGLHRSKRSISGTKLSIGGLMSEVFVDMIQAH